MPDQANALARARSFAEPLLAGETMETGRTPWPTPTPWPPSSRHRRLGNHAGGHLSGARQRAPEQAAGGDAKAFGDNFATLAVETTKLMRVQQQARDAEQQPARGRSGHPDRERAQDAAGLLARSARGAAAPGVAPADAALLRASKRPVSPSLAREALHVFAPLANRLGIWQIKWELEDLSFRFLEPDTYRQIARAGRKAGRARELYGAAARAARTELRATASAPPCRAAQAHLQHRQEDARQVAGL
jgi:GTP pyrophosphokinase